MSSKFVSTRPRKGNEQSARSEHAARSTVDTECSADSLWSRWGEIDLKLDK